MIRLQTDALTHSPCSHQNECQTTRGSTGMQPEHRSWSWSPNSDEQASVDHHHCSTGPHTETALYIQRPHQDQRLRFDLRLLAVYKYLIDIDTDIDRWHKMTSQTQHRQKTHRPTLNYTQRPHTAIHRPHTVMSRRLWTTIWADLTALQQQHTVVTNNMHTETKPRWHGVVTLRTLELRSKGR